MVALSSINPEATATSAMGVIMTGSAAGSDDTEQPLSDGMVVVSDSASNPSVDADSPAISVATDSAASTMSSTSPLLVLFVSYFKF